MDANWLIFGGLLLGLVGAAIFVYKKGHRESVSCSSEERRRA
jgi:LPXTG-motif cell wall-anchored protein